MSIQPIGINSQKYCSFKAQTNYENPVNRNTERNLAILASVGGSAIAGFIAGGAVQLVSPGHRKASFVVGVLTGLATLGLTLPSKLYNTKVNAYARQKEMDVFSRQKSAQSNIYEDIDNEIQDNNVSLDDKINHYATVKMADNGSGVMIKGV